MLDLKKLWQSIKDHPIYNKVVATLIAAILLTIFNKIFSWNIFSSIFVFFGQKYIVSMWYLAAVGIIPIAFFWGIQLLKRKKIISSNTQPDWMSYTQDLIFDILWQWTYRYAAIESIKTDDIIALCPQCKRDLNAEKNYSGRFGSTLSMKCFHCSFKKENITGDYYSFAKLVIREIQGRIRHGEYKAAIKKYKGGK